jgi:hypothetical protein
MTPRRQATKETPRSPGIAWVVGLRRVTGRLWLPAALAAAVLVSVAGLAAAPKAHAATAMPSASVNVYRGLGSWVDLFDDKAWNDPAAVVADLAAHRVRTLYIETSNYSWSTALSRPALLDAFIRACHARHISVVAWYLPALTDLTKDFQRTMAAIRYRTPDGQKFDSFALDIEASLVKPVTLRNSRLVDFSQKIRRTVGSAYPLGAIIPSPVGMSKNATYWPVFPYMQLARIYDVFVPMGYYTYHGSGYANAYSDTRGNVQVLRDKTKGMAIRIHMIGGISNSSTVAEVRAFVRAERETGCLGASLYGWPGTNYAHWIQLSTVPVNPIERPPLPVWPGYLAPLGYCHFDHSHPREVFYEAAAQNGLRILRFRLFDAKGTGIRLYLNWRYVATVRAKSRTTWTAVQSVTFPAASLYADRDNVVQFMSPGAYPKWQAWGVQQVTLLPRGG